MVGTAGARSIIEERGAQAVLIVNVIDRVLGGSGLCSSAEAGAGHLRPSKAVPASKSIMVVCPACAALNMTCRLTTVSAPTRYR